MQLGNPQTDYSRWTNKKNLSQDWSNRARFVSRMIPTGLRILDIGCGAMDVERFTGPSKYQPVDLVDRDGRTKIIDLNDNQLPEEWLRDIDLVTCLGVLEYLTDIGAVMRTIAATGKPLLCSYAATDTAVGADRPSNGWINSFDMKKLEELARGFGLVPVKKQIFERTQVIYLFHKMDAGGRAAQIPWEVGIVDPARATRRSLLVTGFYARGNCGDEALLQCVYEAFKDEYDITISVDEHGAYQGWWDWYPYKGSHRVHQTNIAEFQQRREYAGAIVGGGGLKAGFAGMQMAAARARGIPTVLAGVDFPIDAGYDYDEDGVRAYLNLFDRIMVRTQPGKAQFDKFGWPVTLGADWAWRLPTDTARDIQPDAKRAVIIVREFPVDTVDSQYVRSIQDLIAGLRAQGYKPCLAPFCPEDERFASELGFDKGVPNERHWWNPRRMKQLLGASGLVVSVGRLHPIIFAADSPAPIALLRPAITRGNERVTIGKIENFAKELDLKIYDDPAGLLAGLKAREIGPANQTAVHEAKNRLENAIQEIRAFMAQRSLTGSPKRMRIG